MIQKKQTLICFITVLILSFYTYIPKYDEPSSLFWDENYHIASAQRYLSGVFFMEPHPPLGKLLIAAGEALLHSNTINDQFIGVEKASILPDYFSFSGYRLFPTISAAFIPAVIFLILLSVTNQPLLGLVIASAAIFDNGLIVHGRGAMLEGMQLLCVLISILSFTHLANKKYSLFWTLLMGGFSACALLIKINSASLFLLPLALLFLSKNPLRILLNFSVSFLFVYVLVWHIHFSLGTKIITSLNNEGYFNASERYKEIIKENNTWNPLFIPTMLKDSLKYSAQYQSGVPELNYCKSDESGSYPLFWPLGARSISYRWDEADDVTRYLYLVPNPVGWAVGLLGVFLSFIIIGGKFLGISSQLKDINILSVIFFMYLLSWLSPFFLPRVFYLYHYFLPLCLSWILFGLSIPHLKTIAGIYISDVFKKIISILIIIGIVSGYLFFKPFTYHKPLSKEEFEKRKIFSLWDIHSQHEESTNPLAKPIKEEIKQEKRNSKDWHLTIGNLSASYIEQSVGIPVQLKNGFEIRPKSRIQFQTNGGFKNLSGIAALHDLHQDSELTFRIIGDGVDIWKSSLLNMNNPKEVFNVSLKGVKVLVLLVTTDNKNLSDFFGEWRNIELTPIDLSEIKKLKD